MTLAPKPRSIKDALQSWIQAKKRKDGMKKEKKKRETDKKRESEKGKLNKKTREKQRETLKSKERCLF